MLKEDYSHQKQQYKDKKKGKKILKFSLNGLVPNKNMIYVKLYGMSGCCLTFSKFFSR